MSPTQGRSPGIARTSATAVLLAVVITGTPVVDHKPYPDQKVIATNPDDRPSAEQLCDLLRRAEMEIEVQKYKERSPSPVREEKPQAVRSHSTKVDVDEGWDYDNVIG